jgi:hypothetical protein
MRPFRRPRGAKGDYPDLSIGAVDNSPTSGQSGPLMHRLRISVITAALGISSLGSLACSGSTNGSEVVASTSTFPALLDFTVLPANEPHTWLLRVHCGAAVFSSQLNGNWWRAAEANHQLNWLPTEWGNADTVEQLNVVVQINSAEDRLDVTFAGRTVVYTPTELTNEDYCD